MRARIALAVWVALSLVAAGARSAAATAPEPPARVGSYIVVLRAEINAEAVARDHRQLYGAAIGHVYSHALEGYSASLRADRVGALETDPRVEAVVPNRMWHISDRTTDSRKPTTQELPTGVARIRGDHSSARSGDGRGSVPINVAVIDTGIDTHNPDLNVVGGVNCDDPGASYDDGYGHGTHVAGTIAARDDRSGVVGVAPGARLYSVRVFSDSGEASDAAVLCGVDWVAATRTDADPSNDIAVANMSFAANIGDDRPDNACGSTQGDTFHPVICAATAAGVTFVAAASNDGEDLAHSIPAGYPEVLTATAITDLDGRPGGRVGTTDASCLGPEYSVADDTAVFFSNFATTASDAAHTVAAPGVCIDSTVPWGIEAASGTSMAAPHVTGVVALCIVYGPCRGLRPAEIIRRIRNDALVYTLLHPTYGFRGDPLHPGAGRYYGPLVSAERY